MGQRSPFFPPGAVGAPSEEAQPVPGQLELHANIWRSSFIKETREPNMVQMLIPVTHWFPVWRQKKPIMAPQTSEEQQPLAAGCSPWRLKQTVKVRKAARGD